LNNILNILSVKIMTTSTEHTQDELQSFHSAPAPDITDSISAWDFPDSRSECLHREVDSGQAIATLSLKNTGIQDAAIISET
jgi:hypothetical protein